MTLNCWLTRSQSAWLMPPTAPASPSSCPEGAAGGQGRSMYTRRKRCLPIFHSTSTTSRPSERVTRSAAARMRSKSTRRNPGSHGPPLVQRNIRLEPIRRAGRGRTESRQASSGAPKAAATKKWARAHSLVRPASERNLSIVTRSIKSKTWERQSKCDRQERAGLGGEKAAVLVHGLWSAHLILNLLFSESGRFTHLSDRMPRKLKDPA